MDKKNLITDHGILKNYIENFKGRWDGYASEQLKKCLRLRKYFYSSSEESNDITINASLKGWTDRNKVTLSPIRNSLNRAKSDIRDQQPTLDITQCVPSDEKKVKLNQAILESITLNNQNVDSLLCAADSIFDMSYCVMQFKPKTEYNKKTKQLQSKLMINLVPNIKDVYFDSNLPITNINEMGIGCGIKTTRKDIEADGFEKDVTILEHFEKILEKCTYGTRYDALKGWVTEKVVAGVEYDKKTIITLDEVCEIRHWVYEDNELIIDEEWPYLELPYVFGTGVAIDNFESAQSNRLTLVPFAENVVSAQNLLNQAATLQMYNLSQTRGTSKAMYMPEMIEGYTSEWKNRNTNDTDLPFNPIKDLQGNILPLKPEFVPDTMTSPVITEIMQTYPGFIQQALGNEHEETINYNKSGEAIKTMMIVASKNLKLYLDGYERLLGVIGVRLQHYIPRVYDTPQHVTVDLFGKTVVEEINTREDNRLKNIMDEFKIEISLGPTQRAQKDKTIAALTSAWQANLGTDIGAQMTAATIDIYGANMDSPFAQEIAKRWTPLVPPNIQKLIAGATVEDVLGEQDKNATANADAQNNQQEMATQLEFAKQNNELMKAQASLTSAQGRWKSGEAALIEANKEGNIQPIHVLDKMAEQQNAQQPSVRIP